MRENTRDTKKFKILFDENVTYGFRRNLLGLKWAALILDVVILLGCGLAFARGVPIDADNPLSLKLEFIGAFAIVHGCYIGGVATKESVREAAVTYARQLLLCCETLATGAAPKRARAKA